MSKTKPGPTGKYPDGKISQDDDGELAIGFSIALGGGREPVVVMNFSRDVSWIGFRINEIDSLCETLQDLKKQIINELRHSDDN